MTLIKIVLISLILTRAFSLENIIYPYTGTFSDLRCIKSEGDIVGTEITIISAFNETSYDYYALVQFAEGTASKPVLLRVDINSDTISFTVNYMESFDVKFLGKITKESLVGRFGYPLDQKVVLKRKESFWNNPGDLCFR